MAYSKTVWSDRQVQYPMRYQQAVSGSQVTLTPDEGFVVSAGTPLNAANLNKLESQYENAVADAVAQVKTFEAWQRPTYANSYADYGGTYGYVFFRKTPFNELTFKGVAKSSGALEGNTMFTLPVGYRPPFDVVVNGVDNKWNPIAIVIRSNGTVTVPVNATYDVDTAFISFDGIRVPLE